jgi:hypothetical protein
MADGSPPMQSVIQAQLTVTSPGLDRCLLCNIQSSIPNSDYFY